jgi:MFS family permease
MIIALGIFCLGLGIFILSRVDASTSFLHLVPGMMVIGAGLGLFYSSITTAGITSVDPARTSLASAIIFMVQNAGGAVGLGLTTAIVVTASSLPEGIHRAYSVNAILALVGLVICLLFVAGPLTRENLFPRKEEEPEES